MPNYTKNINLILPFQGENYNVDVANTNNNAIDLELARKVSKINGKDLSSNDFTDEYKTKVDKVTNMFYVKGTVDTEEDLESIVNPKNNDVYLVKDTNHISSYSSEDGWIDLGLILNVKVIEEAMLQKTNPITASITIPSKTKITNGYILTLPLYYQVGNNSLEVRLNSEVLKLAKDNKNGHYKEVGNEGKLSNVIQFYRTTNDGDWTLAEDIEITEVVRGVSQE